MFSGSAFGTGCFICRSCNCRDGEFIYNSADGSSDQEYKSIRINTMAMINKIRCICRLRLLRALFFFASLIPLILFLLYFKILSVFQTTKTTVHCRNGLSDFSIQKGLVQIFASFHIYVSKIFFACTDADIEFNFTFFGNLFQAVNKCWNIIQ